MMRIKGVNSACGYCALAAVALGLIAVPLPAAGADAFSLVVLPDTQNYSQMYPQIFADQTQWVCDQVTNLNIRFVTHLGDIVSRGAFAAYEWQYADAAMSLLDGIVPWGTAIGNHDYDAVVGWQGVPGSANRYLSYFGPHRFSGVPWYAGASANGLNSYQIFTGGGRTFRIMHIEMDWPDPALAWAEEVLAAEPGVPTIISTHNYIYAGGRPTWVWTGNPEGNSGKKVWDNFISKHREVFMVINGHHFAEHTMVDRNEAGLEVYQMVIDYQDRANGGNGWLRIFTFDEENSEIRAETYSPWLDQYETDANSQFTLAVDFGHRFGPGLLADRDSLRVIEGETETFRAKLDKEPVDVVTVTVARVSGDPDITVQSGGTLRFDTNNWMNWQTVTVSAAQDADSVEDSATIACTSPNAHLCSVAVQEIDDEYGLPGITNGIPYAESFESYSPGRSLIGRNGWCGPDADATEIVSVDYSSNYCASTYPLNTTHTKALRALAGGSVTNRICGVSNGTIWVDCALNTAPWLEEEMPAAPAGTQLSLCVSSNGHLTVYHGVPQLGSSTWTELTDTSIATDDWVRVMLKVDYETVDTTYNSRYFQVYLNETLMTNAAAYTVNDGSGVPGGTWFSLADTANRFASDISMLGGWEETYLDDLRVTDTDPRGCVIVASAGIHGSISPSGAVDVPESGCTNFIITADRYCYIADILTNGASVGGDFGMVSTNYSWDGIARSGTIRAVFGGETATNNTPKWWLASYDLTNGWDVEAMDDQDGDGMLTWEEYAADTDPTDEDSVLSVIGVSPTNAGVRVEWKGGEWATQRVERSRDPASTTGQWTAIFTNEPKTPVTNALDDVSATNGTFFYRIRARR
ncbi:metallophosphoesterase [Verrucomicrobiota bacterium]